MDTYAEEKKKALDYMAGTQSRVAITSDLWTSNNQRGGTWLSQPILLMMHGCLETL